MQTAAIDGGWQNYEGKTAREWAVVDKTGVKKHRVLVKANFEYVVSTSDRNNSL